MNLKRIDIIALNGGDGIHYKYNEVAEKISDFLTERLEVPLMPDEVVEITKILVEAFPNDASC